MIIYNKLGVQVADVDVSDDSYRHKAIMGENSLTLYFSLPEYAEIPVGSYCEFKGERYTLILPENLKRHGKRNLEYTLVLESEQYLLTKYKVRNLSDKRLKFPFTAKPIEHLQLIVDILNLKSGGWSIGECIDAVEKEIVYSHTYLNEALKLQAETFETEYEIVGKSISLKKVEYNKEAPLELSYGHGNGFEPGCGRSNYENTVPVEVLFVQGGDKNVDFSKYGSKQLLLPKSQSLVYEGRTYVTDADGLFVTRGDKAQSTGQEDSLDCSHIFPSRVGTVTSVDIVSEEGNLYDILDNTIPAALDYSLCRIAGEKATIRFESGMLAGKEFDLVQSESAFSGYVHADRRFKIVPQEIDGQIMPNDTFSPSVGDKYAIFGIQLPDAYFRNDATKTGASWDMFREGAKYLFEHEDPRFSFTGQLNGIWSKTNWLAIGGKIKLGGYVAFTDVDFQTISALVRIIDINEYVNSPYEPKIELSNVAVGGSTLSSELKKLSAEEVITEGRFRESLQFTKRRFRDAQETMTLLSQSLLNFSGSVSPITVQTMALLVGDESLQFRFVNSKTVPVAANHVIAFSNATKVLSAAAGILQHMTVGIKTISQSHLASEYRYWDMAAYDSPPLTEANASKAYYLYAKCANAGTNGVFILSDVAIGMTSVAGYYHFLVGILNSENASERSYVSLYGFSEILPGRITTDKIVSPDGRLSIDLSSNPPKITALDGAIIEGKVQFQAGSSGLAQLAEWPTAAQDIQDAAAAAAEAERKAVEAQEKLANDIDPKLAKMQEQIDGEVSNYYLPYSPTLANYPASEWLTTIEKEAHLGDTFNNNLQFISDIETPDAGKFWRWTKSGTDYFWNQISDSDSVLALKKAAEAKGVADGKSTHYLIQPTAYKFGDSWVCDIVGDAEKGSMLFATQDSNVFNRAHWVKKDKYTDDTAVANLKVGAKNLLLNSAIIELTSADYPSASTYNIQIVNGLKEEVITSLVNDNTAYRYKYPFFSTFPKSNTDYVLSFDYKSNQEGGRIHVDVRTNEHGDLLPFVFVASNTGGEWKRGFIVCNFNITVQVLSLFQVQAPPVAGGYIGFRKLQVELGNKATDWTPAPEDVAADASAKAAAAQAAAESYALSKANLAEVTAKAYADGIVTDEEVRAIADATAKANAAQAAAVAAAAADATAKSNAAQAAAQDYALAKANLAEVTAKSYADGAVTVEESRAIADATAKANAAQAAAIAAAAADATAKANAAQTAAQEYALAKANLAEITAKAYADGIVTDEEVRAIADATAKANTAQAAAVAAASADATAKVNAIQVGGKNLLVGSQIFSGWYGSGFSVIGNEGKLILDGADRYVFSPHIGIAVGNLVTISFKAKVVGAANADINIILNFDTEYDVHYKQISSNYQLLSFTTTYINSFLFGTIAQNIPGAYYLIKDVKVELGNKATDYTLAPEDVAADASAKAAAAQAAAESYALAKANLAEVTAKAYADGIVTDEEVRAIADATVKANAAQAAAIAAAAADATAKANAIQIGGRNLIKNSKSGFDFNYSDYPANTSVSYITTPDGHKEITITSNNVAGSGTSTQYRYFWPHSLFVEFPKQGEYYTYSFEYKSNCDAPTVWFDLRYPVEEKRAYLQNTNGEWKKGFVVCKWDSLTSQDGILTGVSLNQIGSGLFLSIRKFMFEKGNKASDWTPALEDVQAEIDAAKAKALELDYLKTALMGTTEVAGGLILARMMMLKNAQNQVTAGISGMDSNDLFLFANDTDALNAALNNMATFLLRRNGTGNLGTLKFTRNGLAYCTRNADGTLGKAIIEFRNTPIPPLSDLVASFTDTKAAPGGNATKMGGVLTGNFGYGVPIIVSAYDNFSMRITGTLEASINNVGDMPILDSHAAINLVLYKYDGGVYTVEQNVSSLYLLRDVTGADSDSIAVDETYTLAKGTYYLRAEYYINTSEGSHDSGFVSAANLQMVASGASGNQTMIFGSNGFVRVKDGNNFTYMSDEMMAHRGVSDMPGFRSTANISASGILTNIFGLNIGLELLGTGLYKITHNIGHMNYTEHLTIVNTEARLNAVVSEKAINYFTVKIVNVATNTSTNSAFEVSINSNG